MRVLQTIPRRGQQRLLLGTGQWRSSLYFGLEDLFRYETASVENELPQAVETLEFRKLLDPRYRGEKYMANDFTVTTTYHSLCRMVSDRTIDCLRCRQRHLRDSIRCSRF